MIEAYGVIRRGGHRTITNSERPLFDSDPWDFMDGIRPDLYDAVVRQVGRGAATSYHPQSGRRLHGPVQPIIRRQARATLRSLGLTP